MSDPLPPIDRLFVFLHVATIGRYHSILPEVVDALSASGLQRAANGFFVSVVGSGDVDPATVAGATGVSRNGRLEDYEFPTLALLQNHARANPRSAILYLHLKGVSVPPHKAAPGDDWRNYMLHFLVERHAECMEKLTACDVCGVDWRQDPAPHFSGNFWWARSEYLATLPPVEEISREGATVILSRRHNAEFWIGMNPGVRASSLFDCGIPVGRRYNQRLPRHFYEQKTGRLSGFSRTMLHGRRLVNHLPKWPGFHLRPWGTSPERVDAPQLEIASNDTHPH